MNVYLICIDNGVCMCIKAGSCDEAKQIAQRKFPEAESIKLKVDTFANRRAIAHENTGNLLSPAVY